MTSCAFEKDLSLALREGLWPAAADPALRQHVAACSACSDLVLVTTAMQSARAVTARSATLPPPGILYWRAQIRRRSGAVERMSRPLVFAEGVTLLLTLFALALAVRRFAEFLTWSSLTGGIVLPEWHLNLADMLAALPAWTPLLLIAGVVFFALGGLAVYVLAHNE